MSFRDEMRASKAIGSKNYDAAIEIYKKKIEANPIDYIALSMLAHCYEWKDDRETALEYANKQLAQYPKDFYTLILAARCWSEKDNEDQTYNYACRALENVPRSEPEDMSMVTYFVFKLLSVFKKFRKLPSKARESNLAFMKHYKENLEWARQYKQWYEAKHGTNASN